MNQKARWWESLTGELTVYYGLVGTYFFAFGLQFVLFPSLITFTLGAKGAALGAAQIALSGPMFALLLITGVYAERAQPGRSLMIFQAAMAIPPLILALLAQNNALTYSALLAYAVMVGSCAAFILPVRDAALNGVITREVQQGRRVALTTAATAITAIQIGAQIAGILSAQFAERIGPAPLLVLQAGVTLFGAVLALRLRAPAPAGPRRTARELWNDLVGGVAYAVRDRVIGAMLCSGAYAGIFILGSGQVLFPLIVRDSYGGGPHELSLLYACFWAACFVSAALLSRFGGLDRPGRGLILAHLASAGVLASFAFHTPLWMLYIAVTGWGLVSGVAISTNRTIVQAQTDKAYLGRALALYSMGFMGGAPIGAMLAGVASDHFGPRLAALAPAIGLAVSCIALALLSPIWFVPRPEEERAAAAID
jgi:MFS family permease